MSKYNMEILTSKISKDDLNKYYAVELHSILECAKKFNTTITAINTLIKYYDIKKDMHAARSAKNAEIKNRQFESIKARISYNNLYNYYVRDDHGYYDTLKHFNVTDWTFNRLLDVYNIKKDRAITAKKGVATKYAKAGSKEAYLKEINEKSTQTKIKKYGSLEAFIEHRTQTTINNNRLKYGVDWKATADMATNHNEQYAKIAFNEIESIKYLESFGEAPTIYQLTEHLNCSINCIHLWIERFNLQKYIKNVRTKYELEIIDFIKDLGIAETDIKTNCRTLLDNNKEIDIYIPSKKLAIEVNGNYWHSDINVPRKYHLNKSILCENLGVRLIHIYQYEWDDFTKQAIIKSIITQALSKCKNRIFARKCYIKELKNCDVREFLNKNHIQGYRTARIILGLFSGEELVQVMTFSKNKNYGWEIIRECSKLNTLIIGGCSKLYKYFTKVYNPEVIFSYCDFNKFTGHSYEKLGMQYIGNTGPDMKWLLKNNKVINRHPEKHSELKELAIGKIWGAGSKKYLQKFPL